MAYEMTLKLSDQEHQDLTMEAAKSGKEPEALLHEMIQRLPSFSPKRYQMSEHEFTEKLYREGKLLHLAIKQPLTGEEQVERERLVKLFAGNKLASDMVIEDRGPF